ncbi:peptidase dimerization domain-containing protein [Dictyobacter vulcani]|uniref:peptidase dimerization domain-containing protein n=1 Tax=Dictyobacter vulcani TaxID=2607529 RepID=UPI0018E911E3|nr:peptidase dimerization domain-containing protein [Dictyobacter vulcani]
MVADGGNDRVGEPILTTSLRGMASVVVEVRSLKGQLHSGGFGGPTPDALVALIRILSTLHDDNGSIAILDSRASPGMVVRCRKKCSAMSLASCQE